MKYKVVEFDHLGGPEVLQLRERALPKPGPQEVLVEIKAGGLNQAELLYFQGNYIFQPQFPSSLGLEASGIIHSLGTEVSGFELQQEVCLSPNIMPYEYGYWGTYALAPLEALIPKPSEFSFEEGAAFWMTYPTAYAGLIIRGRLKKEIPATVLITAASSSVGIAASPRYLKSTHL